MPTRRSVTRPIQPSQRWSGTLRTLTSIVFTADCRPAQLRQEVLHLPIAESWRCCHPASPRAKWGKTFIVKDESSKAGVLRSESATAVAGLYLVLGVSAIVTGAVAKNLWEVGLGVLGTMLFATLGVRAARSSIRFDDSGSDSEGRSLHSAPCLGRDPKVRLRSQKGPGRKHAKRNLGPPAWRAGRTPPP